MTNRTILGVAFAIAASLGVVASTAQADPVLQGYWTFDSDTVDSGIIVESSGYQAAGTHDGTLVNNTSVVDEQTVNGISFNPIAGEAGNHLTSGNYISFSNDSYAVIKNTRISAESATYKNSFDFGGKAFTISCWVKGLPDGNWEPYISKYGENSYGYQVRRQSSNNYPTFTYRRAENDADDPAPNIVGVNTNVNDGKWHNIVSVFGGTYREQYLDGQLIMRVWNSAADCSGTNEPVVFSARYNGSSKAYQAFANISLDDVAIYSGALTANQVAYLNNGGDPTNLVAAQRSTINLSMTSGKGDKSTQLSFSGKTSHSWLDGEAIFDGGPGYLKTNLPVGAAGFNGSFTASAWVYMNDVSGDQAIFGNSTQANSTGLHLMVRSGQPHLGFYGDDLRASQTLEANQWYYLTFQYDANSKTQRIFLDGEQIATGTAKAGFSGTKNLDIGKTFDSSSKYFNGKMKGISITDGVLTQSEIEAQMNADRGTKRTEDFSMGKNTDEWYSGAGSTIGVVCSYQNKYCLHSYYGIGDGSTSTVYNQAGTDANTTAIWGPQFTVADELPEDAAITFSVAGSKTALNFNNSRSTGGAGVALWDLTEGDFVRDSSGNVISRTGNSNSTWYSASLPLKGLEGHNVMIVAMDRQVDSYGWIGVTDLTADITQISNIADAAQHHLVLNNFNFDTAGDFSGMYEIDAAGNRLDSVTHFTNGSRNGSAATNYYVDESGTISAGTKGFLSTGTAAYGEEQTTGVLRSDPFLVQGDIMEFLIAGGNNINNKHMDLIDADTEEVYFSATGNNINNFQYDFWNLKDIQGKSVYLKIVDADGGTSWSHMELDQIRQIKFAPTEADVVASENAIKSASLVVKNNLPGYNAEVYNLEGTGIESLTDLANYITSADPDDKLYRYNLRDFKVENVGIKAFSTLDIESAGQYTLAISNDEPIRIMLNGDVVFESEGTDGLQFIPLTLSETGQYALDILYLNESGNGAALYAAEGAFDAWDSSFALLNGFGDGYINSFASYFVPSNEIPEPSTWALLVLGALGLLFWKKRDIKK